MDWGWRTSGTTDQVNNSDNELEGSVTEDCSAEFSTYKAILTM